MVKRLRTIGLASAFIAVQRRRVVPVEAGHAQVGAVAGTEQALFREEGEGIRADEAAECLHVQPVGDQFRFRGNVDAVFRICRSRQKQKEKQAEKKSQKPKPLSKYANRKGASHKGRNFRSRRQKGK